MGTQFREPYSALLGRAFALLERGKCLLRTVSRLARPRHSRPLIDEGQSAPFEPDFPYRCPGHSLQARRKLCYNTFSQAIEKQTGECHCKVVSSVSVVRPKLRSRSSVYSYQLITRAPTAGRVCRYPSSLCFEKPTWKHAFFDPIFECCFLADVQMFLLMMLTLFF
jgi:hypothetical protein